jgi:hypothetical protein
MRDRDKDRARGGTHTILLIHILSFVEVSLHLSQGSGLGGLVDAHQEKNDH